MYLVRAHVEMKRPQAPQKTSPHFCSKRDRGVISFVVLVDSNAGETARENLSDGAYDAARLLKVALCVFCVHSKCQGHIHSNRRNPDDCSATQPPGPVVDRITRNPFSSVKSVA